MKNRKIILIQINRNEFIFHIKILFWLTTLIFKLIYNPNKMKNAIPFYVKIASSKQNVRRCKNAFIMLIGNYECSLRTFLHWINGLLKFLEALKLLIYYFPNR